MGGVGTALLIGAAGAALESGISGLRQICKRSA